MRDAIRQNVGMRAVYRRILLGLTALAAVTALAGCGMLGGSTDVADASEPGAPTGISYSDHRPRVLVTGEGDLKVVLWGSSSCPAVATEFDGASDPIEIGFAASDERACTDDLAPMTYTFDASRVEGAAPARVVVRLPDGDPISVRVREL